jgi:hypothetical protein
MRRPNFSIVAWFMSAGLLCAQTAEPRWQPLQFLIGKWKGAGTGEPGAGQGSFSFLPDLSGKVLVRRSFNQPAAGARHEDLMIVYLDASTPHAIYFDSEDHTIRYNITYPAADTAVFESGEQPGYRLTYVLKGGNLNGKFEVGGKTYLTWTAVRE